MHAAALTQQAVHVCATVMIDFYDTLARISPGLPAAETGFQDRDHFAVFLAIGISIMSAVFGVFGLWEFGHQSSIPIMRRREDGCQPNIDLKDGVHYHLFVLWTRMERKDDLVCIALTDACARDRIATAVACVGNCARSSFCYQAHAAATGAWRARLSR
jgi:hypothetical protein